MIFVGQRAGACGIHAAIASLSSRTLRPASAALNSAVVVGQSTCTPFDVDLPSVWLESCRASFRLQLCSDFGAQQVGASSPLWQ